MLHEFGDEQVMQDPSLPVQPALQVSAGEQAARATASRMGMSLMDMRHDGTPQLGPLSRVVRTADYAGICRSYGDLHAFLTLGSRARRQVSGRCDGRRPCLEG